MFVIMCAGPCHPVPPTTHKPYGGAETLMDPEKRAEYDAISGFQLGGTNPFRDVHAERDQVFVDEFSCIGCRNCNNVCPRTFEMEDEYGRARVVDQGLDTGEQIALLI